MNTHFKPEDLERFHALRARVFKEIKKALEEDGHCKHYEGAFQIHFPNYFEDRDYLDPQHYVTQEDGEWGISLDCYILGPRRHYLWRDKRFAGALEKAEADILSWFNTPLE